MVRINTSGKYEWRKDLYDRVGDTLGENTRSGAIDGACEFTVQMIDNLARAKDHPDMTPELAKELSTPHVRIERTVETTIEID